MRQILLFGAGKSSLAIIDYFLQNAAAQNWQLILVDADLNLAKEKLGNSTHGTAVSFDITDSTQRYRHIEAADIVISLMPPALHYFIALDCLRAGKNLLTASYVDEKIRALEIEIAEAGLLFLCEMGLDPGIDHMSAKKLIDGIHADGGAITSFYSHCGGLVAPESDDNPWHYKISWNPRNVVMAGKAGAVFKEDNRVSHLSYEELFAAKRWVPVSGEEPLCWYHNRDSLGYIPLYGLEETDTFIRTTLRHPDFISGWKKIIDLKITDENKIYATDGKTLQQFFKEHVKHFHLDNKLHGQPASGTSIQLEEHNLLMEQLFFLGMNDNSTYINLGLCSAADVLQFALEKKLMLQPGNKDRVVMLHELIYKKDDKRYKLTSQLLLNGEDHQHTAMAKTVGMPLAIAAALILNGGINLTGLHIPITKEIYNPVLTALDVYGICFTDQTDLL